MKENKNYSFVQLALILISFFLNVKIIVLVKRMVIVFVFVLVTPVHRNGVIFEHLSELLTIISNSRDKHSAPT